MHQFAMIHRRKIQRYACVKLLHPLLRRYVLIPNWYAQDLRNSCKRRAFLQEPSRQRMAKRVDAPFL